MGEYFAGRKMSDPCWATLSGDKCRIREATRTDPLWEIIYDFVSVVSIERVCGGFFLCVHFKNERHFYWGHTLGGACGKFLATLREKPKYAVYEGSVVTARRIAKAAKEELRNSRACYAALGDDILDKTRKLRSRMFYPRIRSSKKKGKRSGLSELQRVCGGITDPVGRPFFFYPPCHDPTCGENYSVMEHLD